jgi:phenylacetate-CoA ligase
MRSFHDRGAVLFDVVRFGLQVIRLRSLCQSHTKKIVALQERRWRDLVRHASHCSPFYRERFRRIDPSRCQLSDLPPLTKAEMMAHFDDLVTDRRIRRAEVARFIADPANLGRYYLHRYAVCHTSGSQGQPALIVQERGDILLGLAAQLARGREQPESFLMRLFRGIRTPIRLVTVTQKPGFYPSGAVFSYLAAKRAPMLRFLQLSVFEPVADLVARLNEFQPEIIIAYPSALAALAREQDAGRLRQGGRLRQIVTMSEPLPETVRATIESAFGHRVADHYALAECMALSTGCDRNKGAHLNSDLALLEIVDEQDRPVPDGTPGSKVLVTNLYNRVQPLIRYQVEDVVTMSPSACPCGNPFPLIASIAGRTEDRFWIEVNGAYREIASFLFLAALHHCTDLAEHQILQTGRNHFVVRVEPQAGKVLSSERIDRLIRQSVEAEGLGDFVAWSIEIVPEILPNPGSGKVRRVRNLVGPPPGRSPREHWSEVDVPR